MGESGRRVAGLIAENGGRVMAIDPGYSRPRAIHNHDNIAVVSGNHELLGRHLHADPADAVPEMLDRRWPSGFRDVSGWRGGDVDTASIPIIPAFARTVTPSREGWNVAVTGPDGRRWTIPARQVVLTCGAFGTTTLLLRSAKAGLSVSDSLGTQFRPNADVIACAAREVLSETVRVGSHEPGTYSEERLVIPTAAVNTEVTATLEWHRSAVMYWDDVDASTREDATPRPIGEVPIGDRLLMTQPSGGCRAAERADDGVVNGVGEVFACASGAAVHKGLMVADASVIPMALPYGLGVVKATIASHVAFWACSDA